MKLHELQSQLADKLGSDELARHYLKGADKAFLADLAGIPVEEIEDDEIVVNEGALGWDDGRSWEDERRDRIEAERQQQAEQMRQQVIDRASFGGAYRIAAALARNNGEVKV